MALAFEMENFEEKVDGGFVARVFAGFFAQFARGAVEGPLFGNLYGYQLYDNVHRLYAVEIVGEMGADAE